MDSPIKLSPKQINATAPRNHAERQHPSEKPPCKLGIGRATTSRLSFLDNVLSISSITDDVMIGSGGAGKSGVLQYSCINFLLR